MRSTAVVNPSRFCRLQWRAQSTIVVQPSESGRASTGPHDLNSEDPVGEITVIESQPEIGIGRGNTARVIGGGRVHHRSRVE
ncbi:hypothetical protein D0Y65_036345 [Glycine soja]|uniref:Uncharacterized protein n=1 Tax=Glycine soja TaxID=3848 RepID=A0A445HE21_GLYSO|nr:hypothetical protein D0Y65_036345 [Glycine soja]